MPRDRRFVAVHRGGPLDPASHRLLAEWAADCAADVLELFSRERPDDERPRRAVEAARAWSRGEIPAGVARTAALAAHAAAREARDAAREAARAAGHAAATAHMADHSIGAAAYAVRAARMAGGDDAGERERNRQQERLPEPVRDLVTSARAQRPSSFR